jgi:hypothetical protein
VIFRGCHGDVVQQAGIVGPILADDANDLAGLQVESDIEYDLLGGSRT